MNSPIESSTKETYLSIDHFLRVIERRAFNIARLSLSNREDALDVMQETMMTFVRYYQNKPSSEWRALFLKILSTRVIDWHRRHRRISRWELILDVLPKMDSEQPELIATESSCAEEDYDNSARLDALEETLASLPIRQQQAFVYRIIEGFSVDETARIMCCSNGSVKTHLSRAKKRVVSALEDE